MDGGRRIVLATANPGKVRELQSMLSPLGLDIVPQSGYAVPSPPETAVTFVENAILKARHAARHTGLPAIADDSGLEVDVLGGAPGVHSARYAGPGVGDRDNLELLLERIAAAGAVHPAARFQCAMVYMKSAADPMPLVAQGTWEGHIVSEPRGHNGFGYDPVFFVPGHGCTSAELPPEVKNRISHRAVALQALLERIRERLPRHPDRATS